jgi:hypothetical protein
MTGSRRLTPALFAALALACTGAVSAQDPAFVGGSSQNDPANLANRSRSSYTAPVRTGQSGQPSQPMQGFGPRQPAPQAPDPNAPLSPQDTERQIQALMNQLQSSMGSTSGRGYNRNTMEQYERMRQQTQMLMNRNGGQFTASTRALFLQLQAMDEQQQREEARMMQRNGGYEDPGAKLDRGMRQAEEGMRQLNNVLMPMLQDVKRAVDTELNNAATRRR